MSKARLLLIEDEEIFSIFIEDLLVDAGYEVVIADNGQKAWELLQRDDAFETILLDREMPVLDGIELLHRLKASPRLRDIPIIMETAASDPVSIRQGLDAGAYFYLIKPFEPKILLTIIGTAVGHYRDYLKMQESVRRAERPFAFLDHGTFRFRSLEDGQMLANFLARACPEPEKIVLGLQELLINAVEHGNLGITYSEKTQLLMSDCWHEEVARRLDSSDYRNRQVEIRFERRPDVISFTIQDEGKGFDWEKYLNLEVERAFDPHGRGIAMARLTSFGSIEYQGKGNIVVVRVPLAAS